MIKWLLDTNVVSEVGRPRPDEKVVQWLRTLPPSATFISVLTLAEIDQGIETLEPTHAQRPRLVAFRAGLEADFDGRVIPLSNAIVRLWGVLRGQRVKAKLRTPPPIDFMLAATALHHDLQIASRNTAHLSGLGARVFDPWTGAST